MCITVRPMALRIDDNTEKILDELAENGNLTSGAIADFTDLSRPTVTRHLDRLRTADAIEYLHEPTALWRLVDDPRKTPSNKHDSPSS